MTTSTPTHRHSPDYRSVIWFDRPYAFTAAQANVAEILWTAWENGTPDVSGTYLLAASDSDSTHIGNLFRRHPAWGEMIVRGATNGTRRLAGDPPK